MAKGTGYLVVQASEADAKEAFAAWLVDFAGGRVLESSKALSEQELRTLLHESHGEADRIIDQRIKLARHARY